MTRTTRSGLFAAALAIIVGFVAVSSQSLWIDEANSASKAMAPTFSTFVGAMRSDRGSDLQMPLYMFMLWGWEKVFGQSEFALRAMNIPLFAVAIAAVTMGLKQPLTTRIFFAIFSCCSAFLWAYLDEARPYILQFFASSIVMISLVNMALCRRRPSAGLLALFAAGIALLCASSLIGVVFSGFFGLAFLLLWLRREPLASVVRRSELGPILLIGGLFFGALAAYYLLTLVTGAKASGVGTTSPLSTAFCIYELLGVGGLGPGRMELRENAVGAIVPHLPALAFYGAALFLFVLAGLAALISEKQRRWKRKDSLLLLVFVCGGVVSVLLAGIFGNFRVVGRHLMPAMPFLLLGLAMLATGLWSRRSAVNRGIVVTVAAVMLVSAITFRTADRHAKDDYRGATAAALEAASHGGIVWWAADRAAANYYGIVPQVLAVDGAYDRTAPLQAFMANNRNAEYLTRLPKPDLVILSKHDVYDTDGCLRAFLTVHGYCLKTRLPTFEIFSQPRS